MSTLNRRAFLKAGAAASLAGAAGMAKALEVKSADGYKWDRTCDVVVIGFGGAGGPAAVSAKEAGADVLVLEKMAVGRRKCAKFCVCQVLEGGGRNLSPLFYDVG